MFVGEKTVIVLMLLTLMVVVSIRLLEKNG